MKYIQPIGGLNNLHRPTHATKLGRYPWHYQNKKKHNITGPSKMRCSGVLLYHINGEKIK